VRPRGRVVALLLVFGAVAGVGLAACGDDGGGPGTASNCEELVQRASKVAQQVVEEFRDKSASELDQGTAEEPFPELTRPFAPFAARADQLQCDRGELRRLACDAYQGIQPTGPAMEEYLAQLKEVCP
jgi:hypothetical protein